MKPMGSGAPPSPGGRLVRGPTTMSTASGGVTFQSGLDPGAQTSYSREDTVAPEMVRFLRPAPVYFCSFSRFFLFLRSLEKPAPPGRIRAVKQSCLTCYSSHVTLPPLFAQPWQELEVLKAILLREGYLSRIAELAGAKDAARAVPAALPDLLDLLRIASVEVVEALDKWRRAQLPNAGRAGGAGGAATGPPFDWNGVNYLLKMPSDLDFLAGLKPLVRWLGFSLDRNPFAVPLALELVRLAGWLDGRLVGWWDCELFVTSRWNGWMWRVEAVRGGGRVRSQGTQRR